MNKRKSIFVKDVMCPTCNCKGALQILSISTLNNNRIRHYTKLIDGKPQFEYHRVSKEYVEKILAEKKINHDLTNETTIMETTTNQCDQSLKDSGLKPEKDYLFLRALAIRSRAFLMFSTELAKDKRR